MASTTKTRTIQYLEGSRFVDKVVESTNVGQLRTELEIPTNANVNVGGTVRQNDFELEDGAYVAYTSNNKVGG